MPPKSKNPPFKADFCLEERLRDEPRGSAKVVIGIGHMLGVEVDLAIVVVQVRCMVEGSLTIGILSLSITTTGRKRFTLCTRKVISPKP